LPKTFSTKQTAQKFFRLRRVRQKKLEDSPQSFNYSSWRFFVQNIVGFYNGFPGKKLKKKNQHQLFKTKTNALCFVFF
jgi:hypothetical protein